MCREHNDYISLFCKEDKSLLCVNCLYYTDRHKKHQIVPLKEALEEIKQENRLFRNEVKEKMPLIENSIKMCNQNKCATEFAYQNIIDQIDK